MNAVPFDVLLFCSSAPCIPAQGSLLLRAPGRPAGGVHPGPRGPLCSGRAGCGCTAQPLRTTDDPNPIFYTPCRFARLLFFIERAAPNGHLAPKAVILCLCGWPLAPLAHWLPPRQRGCTASIYLGRLFHFAESGAQAAGSAVAAFLVLFPSASLAPCRLPLHAAPVWPDGCRKAATARACGHGGGSCWGLQGLLPCRARRAGASDGLPLVSSTVAVHARARAVISARGCVSAEGCVLSGVLSLFCQSSSAVLWFVVCLLQKLALAFGMCSCCIHQCVLWNVNVDFENSLPLCGHA